MAWILILGEISRWIILFPLLLGAIHYKKLDNFSKLILLIVFIGSIPQVSGPYLKDEKLLTVLYNFYTPIEFVVYWMLFYSITQRKSNKYYLLTSLILFTIATLFIFSNYGMLDRFINELVILNHLFQISWIGVSLIEYYHSNELNISFNTSLFWFLAGVTSYASCTTVFYSIWNILKSDPNSQSQILNIIHHIFNTLLYILFTIGFIVNIKNFKLSKLGRV